MAKEETPASAEAASPAAVKKERQIEVTVQPGHTIQTGKRQFAGPGQKVKVGYSEVQKLIDAGVVTVDEE